MSPIRQRHLVSVIARPLVVSLLLGVAACSLASDDEAASEATGVVGTGVLAGEQTIFANGTPQTPSTTDTAAVELGLKFRCAKNGQVTGVRFYKGTGNLGSHVGHLWSVTGALLATVTFTSESALGWQVARFPSPVAVSANTTYVVSYHAPRGRYAADYDGMATARTSGDLTALASRRASGNGVYRYGASGFPSSSYRASNYWVDVLFEPESNDAGVADSGSSVDAGSVSDSAPPDTPTVPLAAAAAGFTTLALDEEFDGNSLDTRTWSVGAPNTEFQFGGVSYWTTWNQELEYMTASQVNVRNGSLVLTAAQHSPISGPHGSKSYVSGGVSTYGKFSRQFYYAEVRAKLPAVTGSSTGLWPAIWLYDTNFAGNEIDLMESFGGDQKSAQARIWAPENRSGSPVLGTDFTNLSGFNTYGVLKTSTSLQIFFNGKLAYTTPAAYIEASSPAQALILELKLGNASWMPTANPSQWGGGIQGPRTADFEIDWVRYWTN
jgi:beta-glucanase (GH16 family)